MICGIKWSIYLDSMRYDAVSFGVRVLLSVNISIVGVIEPINLKETCAILAQNRTTTPSLLDPEVK